MRSPRYFLLPSVRLQATLQSTRCTTSLLRLTRLSENQFVEIATDQDAKTSPENVSSHAGTLLRLDPPTSR